MKRTLVALLAFSLAGMLATAAASAERAYQKVKGEVIKVEQHVRTRNGGEYDRLTIRTRQGEEMRLRLGEGGACEGCFQEGDRIRARIRAGEGPEADCQVRFMKLRREGRMFAFREEGGRMVRVQDRSGPGARAGRQSGRERSGKPDSGPGKGRAGGGGRGGV